MLDKLFSLDGRSDRREFWLVHIPGLALQLGALCYFLLRALADAYGGDIRLADLHPDRLLMSFADHRSQILPFILAPMLPEIAVAFRRMNDRGRPGWWVVFLVAPLLLTLLIGNPGTGAVNPSYLTAITVVLLAWYFIELGAVPGSLGALERAEKTQAWLASLTEGIPATADHGPAADFSTLSAVEAAMDRAIDERRMADRRGQDRRIGMPDTREVKVERRRGGDRRSSGAAADRRGSQGFGKRGA